jgi:hypothetical protein
MAGRRRSLNHGKTMVVQSVDPILITSYGLGDKNPYWTVVPGVNQYLRRYKVVIPVGWEKHYITITIRRSALAGLRANKQMIDTNTILYEENVFVDDQEYMVIIAEVTAGELTLESMDDTPFGLMVYGSRGSAVYSFAGNVILR